jgi:molybdopterin converting factor small subunit
MAEPLDQSHTGFTLLTSTWTRLAGSVTMVHPAMITFQISGYLIEYAGGKAEIKLDSAPATVGEALDQLWSRHVALRDRVLTERGEVRPHVNIFLNSQVVQRDQVLRTKTEGNDEICIMPAVSGGAGRNIRLTIAV